MRSGGLAVLAHRLCFHIAIEQGLLVQRYADLLATHLRCHAGLATCGRCVAIPRGRSVDRAAPCRVHPGLEFEIECAPEAFDEARRHGPAPVAGAAYIRSAVVADIDDAVLEDCLRCNLITELRIDEDFDVG